MIFDSRRRLQVIGQGVIASPFTPAAGEAGWWEAGGASGAVAVYQPKGAASLAASYTDLSGNGNDAAPGTAPTWDATNGWIFNGTTQYLTTPFVPQGDQSQTLLVRFSNYTGGAAVRLLAGMAESSRSFAVRPHGGAGSIIYENGLSLAEGAGVTAGVLGVAGAKGYLNGAATTGSITTWGTTPSIVLYIGARNSSGTAGAFYVGYIQAVAIYNNDIGATAVAAVTTAMGAL